MKVGVSISSVTSLKVPVPAGRKKKSILYSLHHQFCFLLNENAFIPSTIEDVILPMLLSLPSSYYVGWTPAKSCMWDSAGSMLLCTEHLKALQRMLSQFTKYLQVQRSLLGRPSCCCSRALDMVSSVELLAAPFFCRWRINSTLIPNSSGGPRGTSQLNALWQAVAPCLVEGNMTGRWAHLELIRGLRLENQ